MGHEEGHRSCGDPQLPWPGIPTPALPELWECRGAGVEPWVLGVPCSFLAPECGCARASRQTCCSLCLCCPGCCARVALTELFVPTSAQCAGRRCLSSPWVLWSGGACAGGSALLPLPPDRAGTGAAPTAAGIFGGNWGWWHQPALGVWEKHLCGTHPSASSIRGHLSSLSAFPSVFQMSLPHRNTVLPAPQVGYWCLHCSLHLLHYIFGLPPSSCLFLFEFG